MRAKNWENVGCSYLIFCLAVSKSKLDLSPKSRKTAVTISKDLFKNGRNNLVSDEFELKFPQLKGFRAKSSQAVALNYQAETKLTNFRS